MAAILVAGSSLSLAADTGQIACHDANGLSGNVAPGSPDPELAGFNRQDCTMGASAAQALGLGFAQDIAARGGDWSKLDTAGAQLDASAASWACLRDNHTGLVWEIKTDDGGLRDKDHSYTWRNTDGSVNGGNAGSAGGDSCGGSLPSGLCNTQALIAAVNAIGLCGANDWRLPTIAELETIVDLGTNPRPAINPQLFPRTLSSFYWSATSRASDANGAWGILFDGGRRETASKGSSARVRLVRSLP